MQHQLSPYVASVSSAANQNNQNAPCSSNEALSGGMAIRRRRRKKRETVEEPSLVDTTQPSNMEIGCSSRGGATSASGGAPGMTSSLCVKKNASLPCIGGGEGEKGGGSTSSSAVSVCSCGGIKTSRPVKNATAYSEGSEVEPLSGIDTTASNTSRTVSSTLGTTSGGNGVESAIKPHGSPGDSSSHRGVSGGVVSGVNSAVKEGGSHQGRECQPPVKNCSCSINQRSMIDNQKTRFARNFHELQGGMHRCGVSVKDQIDIYRRFKQLAVTVPIESDSFTDNPAASNSRKPQKRHKRRMKKMAVGGVSPESNLPTVTLLPAVMASGPEQGPLNSDMTKGSTLKHMNMDTTVPTAASEVAQNSSQVSVLTNKGDSGDCDTLTRKKPSEEFSLESLESLDLNSYLTTLPNWKQRGSPWKNIPFHFSSSGVHPSVGAISSSSVNHADGAALSSSYAMECDDTSSNTLEGNNCSFGLNSGDLGAGVCQNPLVVAETEAQQGVCKCAAVGAGGREGERSKQGVHLGVCVSGAVGAMDAGLGDMVDAVFASSGSNSPLSSSSPNQDDDTSGGLFTADEGREGDDELSEGDDGSSVCGLPCAVPWWEEGEMDGTDDATHRPQFPSQLQHILDGIKAAVTTEHTTAGGTIADSHTINSLLKSSAANLLNPSIPKRALPAPDKKGPDLLFLDNSSESYEHLTSPDGSSKSKRSRYSASLMNAAGLSSRHRYSKFHSGKYRKKRRRSYSAGENKNRPTSSMSNFRFNKGGQQGNDLAGTTIEVCKEDWEDCSVCGINTHNWKGYWITVFCPDGGLEGSSVIVKRTENEYLNVCGVEIYGYEI